MATPLGDAPGRSEASSDLYIAVDERIKKEVVDARVVRGMFDGSDHYVVIAKIQIRDRWEYGKKCKSEGRQVIASERLGMKEVREEYEKKVVTPPRVFRSREGPCSTKPYWRKLSASRVVVAPQGWVLRP